MPDDDIIAAAETDLTGEPLLGARQAALVHSVTCRLHSPYPMGQWDLVALDWAARALGMKAAVGTVSA